MLSPIIGIIFVIFLVSFTIELHFENYTYSALLATMMFSSFTVGIIGSMVMLTLYALCRSGLTKACMLHCTAYAHKHHWHMPLYH